MRFRITLLYLCFFVSGASALIYQIVWHRMLTLVFGLSTMSVAAVLSAFLAGLAVGARLFGPRVDRAGNVVLLYAAIELGIGLAGLATGFFVSPLMRVFTVLHGVVDPQWFVSNLIRFVLAFTAYGIPAVLIGATVPAMARLVSGWSGSVGVGFGRFYAVNTIGSVAGAAVAGFVLIRFIGVQASLYVAIAGNVVASLLALGLAKAPQHRISQATTGPDTAASHAPDNTPYCRFALAAAAATGAVALAYEVAWMRLLAVYTLNSAYVFTMVVTVYLAALSIGSGLAVRLVRSTRWSPIQILITVQMALAVLGPVLLGLVPAAADMDLARPGRSERDIFVREYILAVAIVFVPTVLIGMTLPLLVTLLYSPLERAGRAVGRIYAFNAAGTIAGSALTGVVLIPLLGIRGTLLLLSGCSFLVATAATLLAPAASARWRAAPALAATVFVFVVTLVPPAIRFYRPAPGLETERVLYYAEGPSATVHVSEIRDAGPPHLRLYVDSQGVAGTYPAIVTDQKMWAHLPALLHPEAQRALSVGFGTGGTSYSMLLHAIGIDCVEIEPRVADTHDLFVSENHGMVGPNQNRPNFQLIIDDARGWLHVAPRKYDMILTDMTSIQYRGNGNLYTTDFFRLMQDKLNEGGLSCAWVPITGVTAEQLKIVLRSFQEVYPHTSVWYMLNLPTDFVILVGTPQPLSIDLSMITRRMQRPLVQRDLAVIGFDNPYQLLACLLLAEDDVAAYVGPGPLHTDDRPVLDYLTHASRYRRTLADNLAEMLLYRSDASQYVTAWPTGISPGELTTTTDTIPAVGLKWNEAAAHIITGHIHAVSAKPDGLRLARKAYGAAARLLPEDSLIKGLARR
ncbi:MAG: fused MFS/spermidine synthase [Phycisphaerales bacterium]|nr:MAG: fused MFS/spermidine synthase [Phycisphaerales bacterium]